MGNLPYHQLIVWKEAYAFVREVYRMTEAYPRHELYTIVSQIRRAAVSIVTNIVEGHAKHSDKDFLRYLDIARGSLFECSVLMELSRDLSYITRDDYSKLEHLRARTSFLLDRFSTGIRQTRSFDH